MTTIQLIKELEGIHDIEYHYDNKKRCIVDRIDMAVFPPHWEHQQSAKHLLEINWVAANCDNIEDEKEFNKMLDSIK